MSMELMMPSKYLILRCLLHLLPSIFVSVRVSSNELALCIRWPKYWSFSFCISPSNEYGLISSGLTGLISLQSKGLSRVFSRSTVQSINSSVLSLLMVQISHLYVTTRKRKSVLKEILQLSAFLWSKSHIHM